MKITEISRMRPAKAGDVVRLADNSEWLLVQAPREGKPPNCILVRLDGTDVFPAMSDRQYGNISSLLDMVMVTAIFEPVNLDVKHILTPLNP